MGNDGVVLARARELDIGSAIALLEEAVAEGGETAEIAKMLARLSLEINEVRAFQNWCHEALRMAPKDTEVHRMLAAYFRANGRDWEAEEALEIAERLHH